MMRQHVQFSRSTEFQSKKELAKCGGLELAADSDASGIAVRLLPSRGSVDFAQLIIPQADLPALIEALCRFLPAGLSQTKVGIIVEGGVVQNVLASKPVDVTLIDHDHAAADEEQEATLEQRVADLEAACPLTITGW